jgi:ferritin-like metal-binding protein YciE
MAHHELVLSWLNDAYAMEESITHVLENHAKDAKDMPDMQAGIQRHLEVTRRHAELVKAQIERLGGKTSSIKSAMSHVMGAAQGISTGMAKDELIKNALADYSTEHFEIASYTSLLTAAQELGDQQLAAMCEGIIEDEEGMATFLADHIPTLTRQVLMREMQAHTSPEMMHGEAHDIPPTA